MIFQKKVSSEETSGISTEFFNPYESFEVTLSLALLSALLTLSSKSLVDGLRADTSSLSPFLSPVLKYSKRGRESGFFTNASSTSSITQLKQQNRFIQ